MIWLLAAACAVASVPSGLRWLRVAQREHYLPRSVTRFAIRWWTTRTVNLVLAAIAITGLVGTVFDVRFGFLVAAAQIGPVGLSVTGETSPLAWTSRMKRVAGLVGGLLAAAYILGGLLGAPVVIVLALFLLHTLVDAALAVLSPFERRLGNQWVERAAARLDTSQTRVVAITGSYGKTTTKRYVHHLLAPVSRVVASPASFNNRMGLARAVNEQLVPGTEVFIAEMGTYGPGEIRELCSWIKPTVAAMVSVGPVHLERFRTEERIVAAKAEILDRAEAGVIAIDHPLLADLADERRSQLELITVSGVGAPARVSVDESGSQIVVDGQAVGAIPNDVFVTNLAVAVGIVLALGYPVDGDLFASLPTAEHRQSVSRSEYGFAIIDDTFNANPAGAARGLKTLVRLSPEGRRALVTPGMVELGPVQAAENERLARAASAVCSDIVIVGDTNRKALLRGSNTGRASVTVVANRDEAVAWVRDHLGQGDAVLYENDLPDHYP